MKKSDRIFFVDKDGKTRKLNIFDEMVKYANKSGLDPKIILLDIGFVNGAVRGNVRKVLQDILLHYFWLGVYLAVHEKTIKKKVSKEELEKYISVDSTESYIG